MRYLPVVRYHEYEQEHTECTDDLKECEYGCEDDNGLVGLVITG